MCRLLTLCVAVWFGWPANAAASDTDTIAPPFAAPDWRVTDIDGRTHQPWSNDQSPATVLVFISTDCPIANYYHPSLRKLQAQFSSHHIAWLFVQVNPRLTADQARVHARDYNLESPVVLDPEHRLARFTGATKTPQAAVITRDGAVAYLGRIDDTYTGYGKKRTHPSRRDLHDALVAISTGQPVATPRTESIGCFIPFARNAGR